jgi:hypothetical protein
MLFEEEEETSFIVVLWVMTSCQSHDHQRFGATHDLDLQSRSILNMKVIIVLLLYEPGYVIPRVGNLTEEKSCLCISEFPITV